jgi:ABC-type transporter Mla subunit MlaD
MDHGRTVISVFVLAVVIAASVLVLKHGTNNGGPVTVTAEFKDVNPLLEGNYVRVYGGIAGVVKKITLTKRETVMVTMALNEGIGRPRADATASVRAEDLLGENYLSLSLGHDKRPLSGPIPLDRTIVRPRLADILNTFKGDVRAGLQALLTEVGLTLDRRGADLNASIVNLRPALRQVDQLVNEAAAQNAGLRQLIPDVQRATAQLASRDEDLDRLLPAFAGTVKATASRAGELDRGLQALPATLAQTRSTAAGLADLTTQAQPLAWDLRAVARPLTQTAGLLQPFVGQADRAVRSLTPTLRSARTFLRTGSPAFTALDQSLGALRDSAAPTDALLTAYTKPQDSVGAVSTVNVPQSGVGGPPQDGRQLVTGISALQRLSDAFFNKELSFFQTYTDYGATPADKERRIVRGLGVLACSSFGLKNKPGCLDKSITGLKAFYDKVAAGLAKPLVGSALAGAGVDVEKLLGGRKLSAPQKDAAHRPSTGKPDVAKQLDDTVKKVKELPGQAQQTLPKVVAPVKQLLDGVGGKAGVSSLLDFLLGP